VVRNRQKGHSSYVSELLTFGAIMAFLMGFILLATWVATSNPTLPGPQVSLPKFHNSDFASVPPISDWERQTIKNNIVLTITRNAKFFFEEKPVLPKDLHVELLNRFNGKDHPFVHLRADNALPFFWINWTSLQLKALGIDTVYLVVDVRERPHEREIYLKLVDAESRFLGGFRQTYPSGK